MKQPSINLLPIAAILLSTHAFAGDLPALVPVGNPGNLSDVSGYGAVAYEYKIGKFEVTWAEYCEFLSAVAKTDSHSLYDDRMDGEYGGISRSGSDGTYTYSVKDGWAKKPVGYITVMSAARFANWLSNGKGSADTENGSYKISGDQVTVPNHAALAAGKDVKWVIASENEWYKAAYYDAKKGSGGYWSYPAKSDDAPDAAINSGGPSEVGSHKNAVSAYGTFDQGGNNWEFNDNLSGDKWGLRGGSWYQNDNPGYMQSGTRYDDYCGKWPHYGFRIVALGGASTASKK